MVASSVTPELLTLLAHNPRELASRLPTLYEADVADALNRLSVPAAAQVLAALPLDLAARVLDEPALTRPADIVEHLSDAFVASLLRALSPDRRAAIVRATPDRERERIAHLLDDRAREEIAALLRHAPDVAGGIMTTDFVAVGEGSTVAEALAQLAGDGRARETGHSVYVVRGSDERLTHVVSLRELLGSIQTARVSSVGRRGAPVSVRPDATRGEVARLIAKYDLLALPVVDDGGRVLGVVTVDHVLDAMVAAQTEDVHRLGAMRPLVAPYVETGLAAMLRSRAGWLVALLAGEALAIAVLAAARLQLSSTLLLALWIPLVIGSGGSSGTQTLTLVSRALALGELRARDWWRVGARELRTGVALGLIVGTIAAGLALVWQLAGVSAAAAQALPVAVAIGGALACVVALASLIGAMLPFALRALGFGPAAASAPLVATVVDVAGVAVYLALAHVILRGAGS